MREQLPKTHNYTEKEGAVYESIMDRRRRPFTL